MQGEGGQDFSHANAGGSIVAGDQTNIDYGKVDVNIEAIKELVKKLEKEVEGDEIRNSWIEDLRFFEENIPEDDVIGLEAKLEAAGMSAKKKMASRQKEIFVKFLERRALYSSAQQLVALCLHKIFVEFDVYVHPKCGVASEGDLNELIYEKIVTPVVKEYSHGSFMLSHSLVLGMTYWLADRCYVRWHSVAQ